MTPTELQFYDFLDYSSNLLISNPIEGLIGLELFDYQIDLVKNLLESKKLITCSSRQMGITTTMLALCHWYVCSIPNVKVMYSTPSDPKFAKSIFEKFNLNIEYVKNNITDLEFKNKSQMSFKSFIPQNFIGYSLNLLIIDNAEFSFKGNNTWEAANGCINEYVWINSTPFNKYGWFYDMWSKDSSFTRKKVHWYNHPYRDNEWYKEQKIAYNNPSSFKREIKAEFV